MIYVYLDCNKTQEYVFSSRRLRGIRNGSRAIDHADQAVAKLVSSDGDVIRALGGVIIAKFANQKSADTFLHKARLHYYHYGIGIESASIKCPAPVDFYRDVLFHLLREIRLKKDCPISATLPPPSTILAATCETSGRGSAHGLVKIGRDTQRTNAPEKTKWDMTADDPDANDLIKEWTEAGLPSTAEGIVAWSSAPEEEMMGKEVPGTSEARLLGLVFADVNGLGSLLPHVAHDETKFKAFAPALKKCLFDSLKQGLRNVLEAPVCQRLKSGSADAVPFRLLFLGGDDLCFAVTGAYALRVTKSFIEEFETRSPDILNPLRNDDSDLPPHLTLSAGVVIAPYKYPILSFRRLGQGLESHAKHIGRYWARLNSQAYPPSLVDFHLVKNDMAGTIEDVRRLLRTPYPVDSEPAVLFGGPYLVSKSDEVQNHPATRRFLPLDNLLEAAKYLLEIRAGSKLKALRLLLSRERAQSLYRDWWDHLDEAEAQWLEICKMLKVPESRNELPLRGLPHLNTSVLDALELMPLVALRERWER
jgi:hypothetical protein